MEEYLEQQEEELEVLRSIYEGDEQFKELSITCFQYMYGSGENKSILLEISWPEAYPSVVPVVNLDVFHNNSLSKEFKHEIKEKILEQAADLVDTAMTYTLFDWMNENSEDFINRIPEQIKRERNEENSSENGASPIKAEKVKKEQLTKAQKRRITERTNHKGERERGWNWVDVIRHLSQTGVGQGS